MSDISVTGAFAPKIQDLLKKVSYDGNNFYLLDLSACAGPIQGNKAWKIQGHVRQLEKEQKQGILTFGGAFSNHIYQTAQLGKYLNIPTIGFIRTDHLDSENPTLKAAAKWGMKLITLNREKYRQKTQPDFLKKIAQEYPEYHVIPEGGTSALGIEGTRDLGVQISELCLQNNILEVNLPVGTGGTIAGIINGINGEIFVRGYGALKGDFLETMVGKWLEVKKSNWSVNDDQYFGGYAKYNAELIYFIQDFFKETRTITDPIYVGKMLFKAWGTGKMTKQSLFIHTGGQQGNLGLNYRFGLSLPTI